MGSEPADGAMVPRPPRAVVLELGAKPATLEGDPVQVWAPDGARVDSGRPRVDAHGRRLTIPLRGGPLAAGCYHVLYRVVSGDTHLITGRLDFTSRGPSWPAGSVSSAPPLARVVLDDQQRAVLAGGALLAVVAVVAPRRRRHGARHA
jgi:methionine-rich copper-binding protein CopC